MELEVKIKLLEAIDVCRTFKRVGSFHQQQLFKKKVGSFSFKQVSEL